MTFKAFWKFSYDFINLLKIELSLATTDCTHLLDLRILDGGGRGNEKTTAYIIIMGFFFNGKTNLTIQVRKTLPQFFFYFLF